MVFIFTLLFALMSSKAYAQADRPEMTIRSRDVIEVAAGLPVTFADLGSSSVVSPAATAALANIIITESLQHGEEKILSSHEVVRLIKAQVQENPTLQNLNWVYFVGDKIKLRGSTGQLPEARLVHQITSALSQKCETCSFRITSIKFPKLRKNEKILSLELETTHLKLTGSFLLPLRLVTEANEQVIHLTGTLSTKNKGLVLTRSLQPGETISAADVQDQEVEIRFGSESFATREDLNGKTAARLIGLGRPLLKSDLKKETVVLKGQIVRALSGNDLFEVSANMQADENGSVGDVIRLKNLESQKTLSGKVVERGQVRIQ